MKLSELKKHAPKIILAGNPGSGKTALALTLGEGAVVLDLDDGLLTGLTLKDAFFDRRQKVEVKECKEDNPNKALAFAKAASYVRGISDECLKGKPPCRALIVDSLTTLAEGAMRLVMSNNGMLGQHPQIQHWGLRDLELENFFLTVYSLPMVVVLVVHLQTVQEEGDTMAVVEPDGKTRIKTVTQTKYKIALPGKAYPPKLPPRFDELWLARVRKGAGGKMEYKISTTGTTSFITRTRSNLPTDQNMEQGLPALLNKMGFAWE